MALSTPLKICAFFYRTAYLTISNGVNDSERPFWAVLHCGLVWRLGSEPSALIDDQKSRCIDCR